MVFTSSSRPEGIFIGLSLKGFGSVTSILYSVASVHPISPSSSVKMSWYSASKFRALSLFSSVQDSRPESSNFFEQDFSSLLDNEFDATFLGPSSSSKCPNCAICHHHLRNLIGGQNSGNSSSFLDNGMVLSIIEVNGHPLTAKIVCAITRTYMQSSRESFLSSMKWLHHDIHACSHQN